MKLFPVEEDVDVIGNDTFVDEFLCNTHLIEDLNAPGLDDERPGMGGWLFLFVYNPETNTLDGKLTSHHQTSRSCTYDQYFGFVFSCLHFYIIYSIMSSLRD